MLRPTLLLFCMTSFAWCDDDPSPNVVLVLADDMGYGDPRSFNAGSRIPTPHLDRLAGEGMRFTDAHAPGSWCVPSRYGLLTGQYPCRRRLFSPNAGPVLLEDQVTLAGLLRERGYATAMVGKWHLGFEGGPATDGEDKLGGPLDRGFERFLGIHASLDIPPYYYVDGRTPVAPPTGTVGDMNTEGWTKIQGEFWRGGPCAPGFVHAEVLPRFTERAVRDIEELAKDPRPFFLYLALASPHTPWFTSGPFLACRLLLPGLAEGVALHARALEALRSEPELSAERREQARLAEARRAAAAQSALRPPSAGWANRARA